METTPQVLSLFGKNTLAQQFEVEGQPSFDFLHQVHWFIPCTMYQGEVHFARPYESAFHCFEWAVLSLLALSHRDPQVLTEMLGLPDVTFVGLLLSDLKSRHLIDSLYHLTEFGKEEMKKERNKTPVTETLLATFFLNDLTGHLLPFVHIPQDQEDTVEKYFSPCMVQTRKEERPISRENEENEEKEVGKIEKSGKTGENKEKSQSNMGQGGGESPKSKGRQQLSFSAGTTGEKQVIRGMILPKHLAPPKTSPTRPTTPPPPLPERSSSEPKDGLPYSVTLWCDQPIQPPQPLQPFLPPPSFLPPPPLFPSPPFYRKVIG